jgi:hypothetical protein
MDALEIAELVYNNEPRTPTGFYHEAARSPELNYNTFHLRNTHVDPAAASDPTVAEYELCSSSLAQAASWEQTDRVSNAPGAALLATSETDRLYEFERDHPASTSTREVIRLYKCAFLDRSSVNLRAPDARAGRVNLPQVTPQDVRFLAEYLWTFSFYNNAGNAVIASTPGQDTNLLIHEMTLAELQQGFEPGRCDVLVVFEARYTVEAGTGEVSYEETTLWNQSVRRNQGQTQLCD